MQARHYDPITARFISEDTYRGDPTDPLTLNLYTYCHNEPLMYTDPNGHWSIWTAAAAISAAKKVISAVTSAGKKESSAASTNSNKKSSSGSSKSKKTSSGASTASKSSSSGATESTNTATSTISNAISQIIADIKQTIANVLPTTTKKASDIKATTPYQVNPLSANDLSQNGIKVGYLDRNYLGDPSSGHVGFGDFRAAQATGKNISNLGPKDNIFNQEIDLGEVLVNVVAPAVDKYIAKPIQKALENDGTLRGAAGSTVKAVAGTASLFTPVGEVSGLATTAYVKMAAKYGPRAANTLVNMGTGVGFTVITNSVEGKETTVLDLGFTAGYAGLTGMMYNPSPADFNINWEIVKRQYGAQYQPWVELLP